MGGVISGGGIPSLIFGLVKLLKIKNKKEASAIKASAIVPNMYFTLMIFRKKCRSGLSLKMARKTLKIIKKLTSVLKVNWGR